MVRLREHTLSDVDRRLLHLLSKLILESETDSSSNNFIADSAQLSGLDAERLLVLVDSYINQKHVLTASQFIKYFLNQGIGDQKRARNIYNRSKYENGTPVMFSNAKYESFLDRFRGSLDDRKKVRGMCIETFIATEREILKSLHVHPDVIKLVIRFLRLRIDETRKFIRSGDGVGYDPVRTEFERVSDLVRQQAISGDPIKEGASLPVKILIANVTVVTDITTMFTYNDVGLAGLLSTMCGSLKLPTT